MKKPSGYTLIEVLIALAVFAILAVITSTALYQAFNTRSRMNEQADRLNELQITFSILDRDIQQIISRPIRGNEMRLFAAFIGQPRYIEFTRGGITNPNGVELKSSLKRVALLCRENKLIRRTWESLDSVNRNVVKNQTLLEDVDCTFAFLNHTRQVLDEWHEIPAQADQKEEVLPGAIQLTVNLNDWGNMSLLFIIPEALYG